MPIHVSIEQEELRGISRTVAEIHWLLLILILLYLIFGGVAKESEPAISSSLFFYAALVLVAYITTMFAADIRYVLQRAKLLSELDDLTALYNTRGFAIAADRLFGQALRYTRPASVLMVDLDNLKTVNDSHGHDAGNRLLRHTANALRAELRFTDLPARYGGDEFIVLLPETPPRGALDVAERIRKA